MRNETLKKADFDLFVGDFTAKWSDLAARLRSMETSIASLDKKEQKGYAAASSTAVIEANPANPGLSKQELEDMHKSMKAFVACVALFPATWCDAEAATPLPPIVVTEAPATESSGMWTQHPDFFARFKEVWTNCPARAFEKGSYIEVARWFNDNTVQYEKILKTCRKFEAHAQKRVWPPSPQTNKSLQDRFFEWDERTSSWVQKR